MKSFSFFRPWQALALLVTLAQGMVFPAAAAPKKILVLTESRGFTHDVVKRGDDGLCVVEKTLAQIGRESGVFATVNSQNAIEVLTAENLGKFDGVFFYTTGTLIPEGGPREALLDFVKGGKAFVGTHSATDTFSDYSGYFQFINGTFNGHPWGAGRTSTFANHEPSHPVVAMFPESFEYKDEIYQYKNYQPEAVRVLISIDMMSSDLKRPYQVPVTWVRQYGQGRLFYTNFGHNRSTWEDPMYQKHLIQGFRWALGLLDAPAEPNPDLQAEQNVQAFLAVASAMTDATAQHWIGLFKTEAKKNERLATQLSEQVEAFKNLFPGRANNQMGSAQDWDDRQKEHARKILDAIKS